MSTKLKYRSLTFKMLHGEIFYKAGNQGKFIKDKFVLNKLNSEIEEVKKAYRNYKLFNNDSNKERLLDELFDVIQATTTIISNNYSNEEIKEAETKNIKKNLIRRYTNSYNFNKGGVNHEKK